MVVKSDEDVDGYGNGDIKIQPSTYALLPLHLQPLPPYYFILTAYHSPNTKHHHSPNTKHHHVHNTSHNAYDNHLSDNAHDNAHNDADKHRLHHAQAATALSPL